MGTILMAQPDTKTGLHCHSGDLHGQDAWRECRPGGSVWTFAERRTAGQWRIVSWAWAQYRAANAGERGVTWEAEADRVFPLKTRRSPARAGFGPDMIGLVRHRLNSVSKAQRMPKTLAIIGVSAMT